MMQLMQLLEVALFKLPGCRSNTTLETVFGRINVAGSVLDE